eukprot:7839421-Alexandrium_andersonii.AAC.1
MLKRGPVPRKEVRSLAGKLSYFAGLAPRLRSFVKPLWAVFACPPMPSGFRRGWCMFAGSSLPAGGLLRS